MASFILRGLLKLLVVESKETIAAFSLYPHLHPNSESFAHLSFRVICDAEPTVETPS